MLVLVDLFDDRSLAVARVERDLAGRRVFRLDRNVVGERFGDAAVGERVDALGVGGGELAVGCDLHEFGHVLFCAVGKLCLDLKSVTERIAFGELGLGIAAKSDRGERFLGHARHVEQYVDVAVVAAVYDRVGGFAVDPELWEAFAVPVVALAAVVLDLEADVVEAFLLFERRCIVAESCPEVRVGVGFFNEAGVGGAGVDVPAVDGVFGAEVGQADCGVEKGGGDRFAGGGRVDAECRLVERDVDKTRDRRYGRDLKHVFERHGGVGDRSGADRY